MPLRPKVYLAGPDVFLPGAILLGERKKAICAAHGMEGLFPFDNDALPLEGGPSLSRLIYRGNVAMMRAADAATFNLSPFLGPCADTGTSFELGFMTALGKPCVGYTSDPRDYIDRVRPAANLTWDEATARWRNPEGLTVEDFGNADNLMLDESLAEAGLPVLRPPTPAPLDDLAGFEACVILLARSLGVAGEAGDRG